MRTPILVYSASADDPLDAETAAALLGICVDSAYKLVRKIPSYNVPGVGVRFRRSDVMAYLYREQHRRDPKHRPARPRAGTRRASAPAEEVVPGLTSDELKQKAGF